MRLLFTLVLALPFALAAPFPNTTSREEHQVAATPAAGTSRSADEAPVSSAVTHGESSAVTHTPLPVTHAESAATHVASSVTGIASADSYAAADVTDPASGVASVTTHAAASTTTHAAPSTKTSASSATTHAAGSTSTHAPSATTHAAPTLPENTATVNTHAGAKKFPSKEHANKKGVVDPLAGQYGYYDYSAYPYYYPQSYEYAPYAQNGYDYSGYYQQQKELAEYDQAMKEYEYKKYLYETDQTHLRPDLFPETQNKKQEAVKPQSERQRVPTQRQQESPQDSNWVTIKDNKYQSQPQQADEPQYQTKKQTPRPQQSKEEETPEHRNNNKFQITNQAQDDYYPSESNYYPKAADSVIPNPPIRAEKIEAEVHGEVADPRPYKQSQSRQQPHTVYSVSSTYPNLTNKQAQQAADQVYEPQQNDDTDYSRKAYSQQQAPAKQQAYAPAPASYQHYRNPSDEEVQAPKPQIRGYPRKKTVSDANTNEYISYDDIFMRDTIGKRILGKHGLLEDAGADWVVQYENGDDASLS